MAKKPDPINPDHYKSHPSGIEAIDILEHLPYNVASAMKYLWRCGLKQTAQPEEDLKKAEWFIQREQKRLKNKGE